MPARRALAIAFVLFVCQSGNSAFADPPPGYYNAATGLTGTALRNALHAIIDDHTRIPYTSSSTDTWDVLAIAHEDPSNPANILTVYRNASVAEGNHSSGSGWNREHTWPSSYGFTDDGGCNYPYTDCHVLMPADWGYNSARSNRPYDDCSGGCDPFPVDGMPGEFNFGTGNGNGGSWETWSERRGDVARALFYLAVRYEGGQHGSTGCDEPDLILTDNRALISTFPNNVSVAYMGILSTLIEWHLADPVDAFEENKNDVVFGFQGNRNPFIDHPEFVCQIWPCPGADMTPPAVPSGLAGVGLDCAVSLSWSANTEPDLASYELLRAPLGGNLAPFTVIAAGMTGTIDATAQNGQTYEYAIRAIDTTGNVSATSGTIQVSPTGVLPCGGVPSGDPWINEIHYDNSGGDTGEGFEIAGPAGTDLTGYIVVGYNGSNDSEYNAVPLSGSLPNQQNGFGTLWFDFTGMQNGSPDGLALVAPGDVVIEFLSYEGTLTAADGPAAGMTSIDLGVSESSGTAVGDSLPLLGTGSQSLDFVWSPEQPASPGLPNPGQTFVASGCPGLAGDCNGNGIPDDCDILFGTSADLDNSSIPDECELAFRRGDANGDGSLDLSDPIRILIALFEGDPLSCTDAGDANDSGSLDLADVISLLGTVFQGDPPVPAPVGACGFDPTPDALDCLGTCL